MKATITHSPYANQSGINPALINYNHKTFRNISVIDNEEIIYKYYQDADVIWGNYSGGKIVCGNLTGIINDDGKIEYVFEQLTIDEEYSTGQCASIPEILPDGTIKLHEMWECNTGKIEEGHSVLIEI